MTLAFRDQQESMARSFRSSGRLVIAEHLGISIEQTEARADGLGALSVNDGAELLWPPSSRGAEAPSAAIIHSAGRAIQVFANVLSDRRAAALLERRGGNWSQAVSVTDASGRRVASIWREQGGSVFLPFDPDEACLNCWSERYLESVRTAARRRTHSQAIQLYYRVRGLLPRQAQIWLRRRYARRQAQATFPRWPAEESLQEFLELYTSILADIAGEPIPRIAPWPDGYSWAFVLTHDVETSAGMAAIDPVVELERSLGMRSSWNIVPRRYELDEKRIRRLIDEGFEVGVHGLHHDGRDLESRTRVTERLPGMREAAARWDAVGFRSPATQRAWELMPMLGFDYDSSYPDTDPFEPQAGGCCSWLPFFNQGMVELPLTMPQDHTIFVILRRGAEPWWSKAEFLRDRGGMALLVTHPDYLLERTVMDGYRELLNRFAKDESAWMALPREVSAWWRRRADSRVERGTDGLSVVGPAAGEARIELIEGSPWR